jgi:hypothetical protein
MSQLNVNVVAPLGYTGPNLPGNSNFVQVVDTTGDTILKIPSGNNIAIGKDALNNTTTGQRNIAIGTEALSQITSSNNQIAIGHQALKSYTSPFSSNLAIGSFTLKDNVSGIQNSAIGISSLTKNTADNNAAFGFQSLTNNTTGNGNTAFGCSSAVNFTTGDNNTFLGIQAGYSLTSGSDNILIGLNGAGPTFLSSGDNNIIIGNSSTPSTPIVNNEITLGNSSHTVLRCNVTTITSLSDARDKKEITELSAGLDFVKTLKPVEFVWDDRDENGRHDIKDFGFIAQDLKKSQEDAELANTLKLVYEENPEKLEASYGKLIPILVKAIQDLSAKVEALEAKNK